MVCSAHVANWSPTGPLRTCLDKGGTTMSGLVSDVDIRVPGLNAVVDRISRFCLTFRRQLVVTFLFGQDIQRHLREIMRCGSFGHGGKECLNPTVPSGWKGNSWISCAHPSGLTARIQNSMQ